MNASQRPIILIGGAPTAGKSTLAGVLAQRLKIPWISTDQIREIMRATVRREDMPNLFTPEGYDAQKFLTKFSADEIVSMEIEQGEAAWPGIKTIIDDDYTWDAGFIVEGVNILPHLVKRDFNDRDEIKTVFLLDEDEARTRQIIYTRGLWDDADKYPDELKEKEVEWSLLFSRKVKAEASKYGYPFVEVTKQQDDLEKVVAALGLAEQNKLS